MNIFISNGILGIMIFQVGRNRKFRLCNRSYEGDGVTNQRHYINNKKNRGRNIGSKYYSIFITARLSDK